MDFVPYNLFCFASLVVARALADDAFDPPFDSPEDLWRRPVMEEHIQCIRLPWKKDLQEKEIFPLSYQQYHEIFNRTCIVAGFPKPLRPYAVRVGAAARFDGTLRASLYLSFIVPFLLTFCTKVPSLLLFETISSPTRAKYSRRATSRGI